MTEVAKFFVFVFLGEKEFKFFFGGLEGGISDFFKIIAFGLFLILMQIDSRLALNVDRITVCATTIIDGIKNLIDTNKYEKRLLPRILFSILSLVYINYGLIYSFMGGDGLTSFFTTTMHGVVFIFLGITDLWFYYFVTKTRRLSKTPSSNHKK